MAREGSARIGRGIASKAIWGGMLAAMIVAGVALAAPRNGGFETGDLTGWRTFERGGGEWHVYSGRDPSAGAGGGGGGPVRGGLGGGFYRPPQGEFAAVAYQNAPGLNILHRKLRVRRGGETILSFYLAYQNQADRFYTPNSFDFGGGAPARGAVGPNPNQQFRIDLLKPRAPVDTLRNRQIVAELYRTRRDDPLKKGYGQKLHFNLTELGARRRVRLRIAEVDNQAPLLVGIDAVKLKHRPSG